MSEKVFSKGEAIRFGWKTMNDNLGFFIGIVLIWLMASYLPGFAAKSIEKTMPMVSMGINIASWLLSLLLGLGIIKICLKFCDQEQVKLEDLLSCPHLLLRYWGASILCGLAIMGGLILLIIPGIILMIRLQFVSCLIVDRNTKAVDSLKQSFAMTKGCFGELLLFGCLLFLINIAGFLCLFIGLFATIPTSWVAGTFVYRKVLAQHEFPAAITAPTV